MGIERAYLNFEVKSKDQLIKNFDQLLETIKLRLENCSFWTTLNISTEIALIVDHSIKTSEHPNNVLRRLSIINERLDLIEAFENENYFLTSQIDKKFEEDNYWDIAKKGFNFMWPKTTSLSTDFSQSCKMAFERFEQILKISEKNILDIKSFLDVGCGPGRYLYAASNLIGDIKLTGLDTGNSIIEKNSSRKELSNVEFILDDVLCKTLNKKYSMVMCNGVAHHTGVPLNKVVKRHSDLLEDNGIYFVFVYGFSGFELKSWRFLQETVGKYPKEDVFNFWSSVINPLRVQGLMDHTYGVFYETKREEIETELKNNFSNFKRVPGIYGLDVTEEIYSHDSYFDVKCGTGNLRYIAFK